MPRTVNLLVADARWSAGVVAAIFCLTVLLNWSGLGPGDAERYVKSALAWREDGFHLGETHWELRYLFVLPMAAMFSVFGPSETAAAVPNVLYAAAIVAVTFYFARRYVGNAEGSVAAAFVAGSVFFVARPLEVEAYGPEAFFVALSCWCFVASRVEKERYAWLIAAGVVAGFAWTVREQTLYLMMVFGLLTLLSRKDVFRSCVALGFGFGSILLIEWLYYWAVAGDPFYRYRIDLSHRTIGQNVELKGSDASLANRFIRPIRDNFTYAMTTPFLLLAALAAWRPGWRTVLAPPSRRQTFILFGWMAFLSVPICGYIFNLALPRYYPVLAYATLLALALACVELWRRHGAAPAAALAVIVLFANVALADFVKYREYSEARFLADYAMKSAEPIETDPLTANRTRHQLMLRGVPSDEASRRIPIRLAPTPGALFFKSHMTQRQPPTWCALVIADVRPVIWTHALIRHAGVDRIAGGKLRATVARPQPVQIVRVLEEEVATDPATGAPCLSPPQK